MNGQAFGALQSATNALKNVHKELDVETIQDIMDDLAEQHELSNEIANAISTPVGFGVDIDEKELEDELAELERQNISEDINQRVDFPPVPDHHITQTNQIRKDDLRELEDWAS
jgi:charged multivesicular body protein 4